jgi:HEAT repeat protein
VAALIDALDWRAGTENHAISAAKVIRSIEVPTEHLPAVVEALGAGIEKVTQSRGIDNRVRRELIIALGSLEDPRAQPALTKVMTRRSESQNFLFNRLAAMELAKIANEQVVDDLIKGLFMFDEANPQIQLEDVAQSGLIRVGQPALEPTLRLFRGENEEANQLAAGMVEAGRQRRMLGDEVTPERLVAARAAAVLGKLGFRDALEPLIAAAGEGDEDRRWNAAVALVDLTLEPGDLPRVRETLQRAYTDLPLPMKPRLIAAMRQMYDPGVLPFLLTEAGKGDVNPSVRIEAVRAYALLANKEQADRLSQMIASDRASEEGGYRAMFEENNPALEAARACDEDIDCWIGKLGDSEKMVVMKAAYMLGRLGRGNQAAIDALVEKLGFPDVEVRYTALSALDHIAVSGAPAAVAKIDELARTEEGRAIWNQFSSQAIPIQSRLRNRGGN